MDPLLPPCGGFRFIPSGGPVFPSVNGRIELDDFGGVVPSQHDFLVADPHQGRVAVAAAQNDRLAVDRRLPAIGRDDHDKRSFWAAATATRPWCGSATRKSC